MAKLSDVDVTSLLWQEGAAPSTPASTKWRLYFKTTGLFHKDDAGTEVGPLSAGSTDPAWTNYTPAWTAASSNPAIGNGTIAGYYVTSGKTMRFYVEIIMGSTTTYGSGRWDVGLPSGVTTTRRQIVSAYFFDNTGSSYGGIAWILEGATPLARMIPGNGVTGNGISSTTPFTWATSDRLIIQGTIEID